MPIDLYIHPVSSPAQACVITAQYLGVDVNIKNIEVFGGATRTPEYLKINPSHTVPALVENGFSIFESRAVMSYLANKYAPNDSIYPKDAQARAQVDKILYFDASTYYPAFKAVFVPILFHKKDPSQNALDDLKEKVQILEALLGEQNFFAGENATLADISLGVSLPGVKKLFPDLWTDKLEAWYQRLAKAVPQIEERNSKVDLQAFVEYLTEKGFEPIYKL